MERTSLKFQPVSIQEEGRQDGFLEIGTGDVHVHGFSLDIGEAELASASRVLSDDERMRAGRLISESNRRQFIGAHAGLRILLSRYCESRPNELAIERADKGKPFLASYPLIRFNLSHSYGRALVAVAINREVGIDLEKIRSEMDVMSLAKRFLSDRDVAFIENGEPARRHERFFQAWIAREAVFKAAGTGITFPLHCDHIELEHDGTKGRLFVSDGKGDGAIKPFMFLPLEPEWVGAVAAEGADWSVKIL